MPSTKNPTLPSVPIKVNLKLQSSPTGEQAPQAVAYAFTGTGHFITQAAVDDKGTATLAIPASGNAREVRVVVGPQVSEQQITLTELTRRGAQQQFLKVTPDSKELQAAFEIPSTVWPCWIRFCLVQGTLLKQLYSAYTGGLSGMWRYSPDLRGGASLYDPLKDTGYRARKSSPISAQPAAASAWPSCR